ncbi:3-isopropylmalate dehydratase small subunit [Bradyrhizobium sp. Ai1a-2]|uniref:3-isopropylmalate dehydratase small subunit n=1 Tax=Bradyrhizobium sp. Ai1a-2 TaxID=196490 RepID=UPI0004218369|nr:3-isopropylmalate dehydratase small subunit [Bradyrhizobium sp. Ai1a-2]
MFEPFTVVRGRACPLPNTNIDTDIIIRIERLIGGDFAKLGQYAFEALRYLPNGAENPDFPLNQARWRGAPILIAGANFGCGSSREGAVNALMGLGIRSVIASSFGDIFYSNCFQNGLLPIRLPEEEVQTLMQEAREDEGIFGVSLIDNEITSATGRKIGLAIDELRRTAMIDGLDDIDLTMRHESEIAAWQEADRVARPWIWAFAMEGTAL